jgi:tetratricopeptide (TPR) repeat protein
MRWIAAVVLCVLLAARAAACLGQALDLPVLGEAQALVQARKAEQAWRLLAPLERQYAGRPDFDYLLGLAALESGRPNRATFILERVIAVNPGHLAARLEMARAYFALHDFERAEREFGFILESAPPEEIRALSHTYLERMRRGLPRAPRALTGYAEVALGRDTNVSAATAQGSVFIPGLGAEFVLDPAFQRRPDEFLSLAAGLEYAHALSGGWGVVAGADLRHRWHAEAERFDSRVAELQGLVNQRLDDRNALQYTVRYSEYQLDDRPYRDIYSLAAQWNRSVSLRTRIAVSAQGHSIRYRAADARTASSDLVAAGASASHLLPTLTPTTVVGALYLGADQASAGRADGDRRLLGVSVGLQRRLMARVEGYLRLSILESDYRGLNADFGVRREDRQIDAALGFGWELTDRWVLRPQVTRTSNGSNVPLHDYTRTETSIALQRTWD